MRALMLVLCSASVLFLEGCVWIPPVWDAGDEIHSADQIEIGVTTRDEVLELLGEPHRTSRNDHRILYEGRASSGDMVVMTGFGGYSGAVDPYHWRIDITFDENDVVQQFTCFGNESCTMKVLNSLKGSTKEEALQKFGPHQLQFEGTDKSYFVYSMMVDVNGFARGATRYCSLLEFGPDQRLKGFKITAEYSRTGYHIKACKEVFLSESELNALEPVLPFHLAEPWKSHCLAAHRGYATSRVSMGNYYRWGRGPIEPNIVRAYLWYSLAGDIAVSDKNKLMSKMTPPQIAEVERLVAQWEPNPAECEEIAVQADN